MGWRSGLGWDVARSSRAAAMDLTLERVGCALQWNAFCMDTPDLIKYDTVPFLPVSAPTNPHPQIIVIEVF